MKRTLIGLAFLVVLLVGCQMEETFEGEWVWDNIELTIQELNPMLVKVEMDGNIYYYDEDERGVSDDGTYDWVACLRTNGANPIGILMPRNTYEYIELMVFDDYGDATTQVFTRK